MRLVRLNESRDGEVERQLGKAGGWGNEGTGEGNIKEQRTE